MSAQRKPYALWLKQCGEWKILGESHNPQDQILSQKRVDTKGRGIERLELRDLTGPLRTYFDASWPLTP